MDTSNLLPPYKGRKVKILNRKEYDKDPTMITVLFYAEDHTIGNALKHIMCAMPGVEFCKFIIFHIY